MGFPIFIVKFLWGNITYCWKETELCISLFLLIFKDVNTKSLIT